MPRQAYYEAFTPRSKTIKLGSNGTKTL